MPEHLYLGISSRIKNLQGWLNNESLKAKILVEGGALSCLFPRQKIMGFAFVET